MEIKKIDTQSFVKETKLNDEPKKGSKSALCKCKDTISPTQKNDIYDVDLNVTLHTKTAEKKVATDQGCHGTQTCSTCSGCGQTDSGCYQTQRGC